MAPAVPIGTAGEKFLKFNTFSCIFKAVFRFPSPLRGRGVGLHSDPPPLATPMLVLSATSITNDFSPHFSLSLPVFVYVPKLGTILLIRGFLGSPLWLVEDKNFPIERVRWGTP